MAQRRSPVTVSDILTVRAQARLVFAEMKEATTKGPLKPFEKTVADVEAASGVNLPLPAGIDRSAVAAIWPANLSGWRPKHKAACPRVH
jgi:hypothetical protein